MCRNPSWSKVPDIAGMQPAVDDRRRGRCFVAVVAGHDEIAVHTDLPDLLGLALMTVVVEIRTLTSGNGRPTDDSRSSGPIRPSTKCSWAGGRRSRRRPPPGRSRHQHRAEDLQRSAEFRRGHRRRAVEEVPQARQIALGEPWQFQ